VATHLGRWALEQVFVLMSITIKAVEPGSMPTAFNAGGAAPAPATTHR
jgi:hypothetical protein